MIWITLPLALWFGIRLGLRAGFHQADGNWIEHLRKHGWRLEFDEDDPEGPGIPKQMYADYWYEQRGTGGNDE